MQPGPGLSEVPSFMPGVGQNLVVHAQPADSTCAFLISFPGSSPNTPRIKSEERHVTTN